MRNSNVESLRIIAMLMIIGLHYWWSGISEISAEHGNAIVDNLTQSICICGVNIFVLITGWFSFHQNKIYPRKIVHLLIDTSFWGIICLALGAIAGWKTFDIISIVKATIPYLWKRYRWFVEAYIILIILIPYINAGLERIGRKEYKILLNISAFLFIIWPSFLPNPPIDDYGYGFVHFVSLYILITYIRKYINKLPSKSVCAALFIISAAIIYFQKK